MIERIKSGAQFLLGVTDEINENHQTQIKGVVYEAYLIWKEILSLQQDSNRPIVVVENLSYGIVALAPITVEKNDGSKYIVGTNIRVISTKIGSTESHNNEYVLREDLFTDKELEYFMREKPTIVVVDGSTSVSDQVRTSAHIPDGFKGYRNFGHALQEVLYGSVDTKDFCIDEEFQGALRSNTKYNSFVNRMSALREQLGIAQIQGRGYSFNFWYPGEKDLYLREEKLKRSVALNMRKGDLPLGPVILFIQSGIEPEAMGMNEHEQGREFIGKTHIPIYFDDKDHYKQFFFGYEEDYGIVHSCRYIDVSRKDFGGLLEDFREEIPSVIEENFGQQFSGKPENVIRVNQQPSIYSQDSDVIEPKKPLIIKGDAPGGIDLNPAMYNMQIRRNEKGIPLPMPQQPIEIQNIKIDGLFPVIINITPATHLPVFIGSSSEQDIEQQLSLIR